jgi:type II secretory pathway pseudopilin PulG
MWDKLLLILATLGTLVVVVIVICLCALIVAMFYMGIKKSIDDAQAKQNEQVYNDKQTKRSHHKK